jgi:hypothetical protein
MQKKLTIWAQWKEITNKHFNISRIKWKPHLGKYINRSRGISTKWKLRNFFKDKNKLNNNNWDFLKKRMNNKKFKKSLKLFLNLKNHNFRLEIIASFAKKMNLIWNLDHVNTKWFALTVNPHSLLVANNALFAFKR